MTLALVGVACARGERELFSDVNLELQGGDALHVVGANGSGKTTLLRCLCGLLSPLSGEVRWQGLAIKNNRETFARDLLYLGHSIGLKDDLLSWENLVARSTIAGQTIGRAAAYQALEENGLADLAELPVGVLSQGQRKRVSLCSLSTNQIAKLWILDEPFSALDQPTVDALCVKLAAHLQKDGILIYTTHQKIDLRASRALTLDLDGSAVC